MTQNMVAAERQQTRYYGHEEKVNDCWLVNGWSTGSQNPTQTRTNDGVVNHRGKLRPVCPIYGIYSSVRHDVHRSLMFWRTLGFKHVPSAPVLRLYGQRDPSYRTDRFLRWFSAAATASTWAPVCFCSGEKGADRSPCIEWGWPWGAICERIRTRRTSNQQN